MRTLRPLLDVAGLGPEQDYWVFAERVLLVAPLVVPAGWFLVAANVALTAHDVYVAEKAAQAGDLAPAGEFIVVQVLDHYADKVFFPEELEP